MENPPPDAAIEIDPEPVVIVKTLIDFVGKHGFSPFAWWRIVVGVLGLALIWGGVV